jgi:hypothetical protein
MILRVKLRAPHDLAVSSPMLLGWSRPLLSGWPTPRGRVILRRRPAPTETDQPREGSRFREPTAVNFRIRRHGSVVTRPNPPSERGTTTHPTAASARRQEHALGSCPRRARDTPHLDTPSPGSQHREDAGCKPAQAAWPVIRSGDWWRWPFSCADHTLTSEITKSGWSTRSSPTHIRPSRGRSRRY